jgi:hypothetical protein
MWDYVRIEKPTPLSINFMNIIERMHSKYSFTISKQNTLGGGGWGKNLEALNFRDL